MSVDRIFTAVVLPAPFGPSREKTVPSGTARSMPSRTTLSPYDLRSPFAAIAKLVMKGAPLLQVAGAYELRVLRGAGCCELLRGTGSCELRNGLQAARGDVAVGRGGADVQFGGAVVLEGVADAAVAGPGVQGGRDAG